MIRQCQWGRGGGTQDEAYEPLPTPTDDDDDRTLTGSLPAAAPPLAGKSPPTPQPLDMSRPFSQVGKSTDSLQSTSVDSGCSSAATVPSFRSPPSKPYTLCKLVPGVYYNFMVRDEACQTEPTTTTCTQTAAAAEAVVERGEPKATQTVERPMPRSSSGTQTDHNRIRHMLLAHCTSMGYTSRNSDETSFSYRGKVIKIVRSYEVTLVDDDNLDEAVLIRMGQLDPLLQL